ncbi:predicted protein [Lichtheimia corymbifera JMRC:FSU:9682]|uniref:Uncharacterized protein n=1 Tax=Lichtheimia corymbifera JMRC:FSU:9682 TaxID=1263082 RepID=A0A068SAG3_9FUNG|nr:predicted protein [Lichtheimia corymbifera JMRC:FSU:9682]
MKFLLLKLKAIHHAHEFSFTRVELTISMWADNTGCGEPCDSFLWYLQRVIYHMNCRYASVLEEIGTAIYESFNVWLRAKSAGVICLQTVPSRLNTCPLYRSQWLLLMMPHCAAVYSKAHYALFHILTSNDHIFVHNQKYANLSFLSTLSYYSRCQQSEDQSAITSHSNNTFIVVV